MHPPITWYFTTHSYLIVWPAFKSIRGVSPCTGTGTHAQEGLVLITPFYSWTWHAHMRRYCHTACLRKAWTCAINFRSQVRGPPPPPPPPLYTLPLKGVGQGTVSNLGYFTGWKTVKMGWNGQPHGQQPRASADGRPGCRTAPGWPDAVAATASHGGHPVSARRTPKGAVTQWRRRVEGHQARECAGLRCPPV